MTHRFRGTPAAVLRVAPLVLASGCFAPIGPGTSPPARTVASAGSTGRRPSPLASAGDGDDVLKINGDTVSAQAIWRDVLDELHSRAANLPPEDFQAYLHRRGAQRIQDVISETLLYQKTKLRLPAGIEARVDAIVDAEIRKTVSKDHDGRQRRYEAMLKSKGRTLDDERERLRRGILIASYLDQEVKPEIAEPTRSELLNAFNENAESYRRRPRRRMSLIDVRVDRSSAPLDAASVSSAGDVARDAALARAQAARTELEQGADFGDVARRHCGGLHAADGGAWGWISRDSLRERFEPAAAALFDLQAGQISDVVEATDAFFIVRCDEIDSGVVPDFETFQAAVKERLFRRAYTDAIAETVAELRIRANIEPVPLDRFLKEVVKVGARLASQPGSSRP